VILCKPHLQNTYSPLLLPWCLNSSVLEWYPGARSVLGLGVCRCLLYRNLPPELHNLMEVGVPGCLTAFRWGHCVAAAYLGRLVSLHNPWHLKGNPYSATGDWRMSLRQSTHTSALTQSQALTHTKYVGTPLHSIQDSILELFGLQGNGNRSSDQDCTQITHITALDTLMTRWNKGT
jgi:hypothetical protein